jgi:DNA-directed RNA polymerase specialized sigma24 family protein
MPYEPVEIPAELLAELEALPAPAQTKKMLWSKEQDAVLLKFWQSRRKSDVARILGRHENTCRKRHEYLTEKIAAGQEPREFTE